MSNLCNRPIYQKTPNFRGSSLEARYNAWLHSYATCCLTGRIDIELAHAGGYAQGKCMGRKAHVKTLLPLSKPLHLAEERLPRGVFWTEAGFGDREYLAYAERLFDIFEAGDDPSALFCDMQEQADRTYLAQFLGAAA